jgi:hypothetical protein
MMSPSAGESIRMEANVNVRAFAALAALAVAGTALQVRAHVQGKRAPAVSVASQAEKARPAPCYAFLQQGNLDLTCNGRAVRLTTAGDLTDFAVDSSGSQLVVIRREAPRPDRITYFLSDPQRPPQVVHGASAVYALLFPTCGTIVSRYWGQAEDLRTGDKLSFPPYEEFLCSSDRKTIIGTMRGSYNLMLGLPPRHPIGSIESNIYGISASGMTTAYYDQKGQLCIKDGKGIWHYIPKVWPYGRLAVDDGPSVLYEGGTGETCYYKDSKASRSPEPGYRPSDECYALFLYHDKEGRPKKLAYFESDPQWLTSSAAAALVAWASHTRPLP